MTLTRKFNGTQYVLINAYETKKIARNFGEFYHRVSGKKFRIAFLGKKAGILKYGVYVSGAYGSDIKVRRLESGMIQRYR